MHILEPLSPYPYISKVSQYFIHTCKTYFFCKDGCIQHSCARYVPSSFPPGNFTFYYKGIFPVSYTHLDVYKRQNDYTADYLINKLNNLNVKYYRLNCEDILNQRISISNITSVTASINGVSKFDSVWFRRVTLPDLNITATKAEYLYYYAELESFLSNLWLSIKADRWLSLSSNIYQAENKLLQLEIASSIGFTIPKTLVSDDYDEIKTFYLRCV